MAAVSAASQPEQGGRRNRRGRSLEEYFAEHGAQLEKYLSIIARSMSGETHDAEEAIARTKAILFTNWERIEWPFSYARGVLRSQLNRIYQERLPLAGKSSDGSDEPVLEVSDVTTLTTEEEAIENLERRELLERIRVQGGILLAMLADPATRPQVPRRAARALDGADAERAKGEYQEAILEVAKRVMRVVLGLEANFAERYDELSGDEMLNTFLAEEYPERFADENLARATRDQWNRRGRVDVMILLRELLRVVEDR